MTMHPAARSGTVWTALAVVVVYVLFAAGLGNLLSGLVGDDQGTAQFALGHLAPLPLAILVLLLSIRWAGTGAQVRREQSTPTLLPRRWWLMSIPFLAIVLPIMQLGDVPWAETTAGLIALIAVGTLLVGLGEELVIRGILLTAVRAHHGELVTLLATAAVFALAHLPGSLIAGAPPALLALQAAGLAATGMTYYWVRRVTGRLWAAILVHAFTDWVLYLSEGFDTPATSMPREHLTSGESFLATGQVLLWIALALGILSAVREDRRRNHAADSSSRR